MRALFVATVLFATACVPGSVPSAADTQGVSAAAGAATLRAPVPVRRVSPDRHWYTTPDGLTRDQATVTVLFAGDAAAAAPRLRVDPIGREAPLARSAGSWKGTIELDGIAPGTYKIGVVELVGAGYELVNGDQARADIIVSAPEYVTWTLDFEGDAATDPALANTAAIADAVGAPMTLFWNARVWTTTAVSAARADAMAAWTKGRAAKGDEVGLHIHAWTDFVRSAGLPPRSAPSWSGRGDGYDVPLTAFDERETSTLIDHAVDLMTRHGFTRPTAFRAGGFFADGATLRAIAAAGFIVDSSATTKGPFGRLRLPWTLPGDAQPYQPSRLDASAPGDLPILEVPTVGGNTYALDVRTIQPTIRADLAMLAPAGHVATARRSLTLVSHPATIDATERAAIEALFAALAPLRYDRDAGPLRFVTLAQLARAYAP